ncbi:MAG: diacylglycerol kinase [Deltaproteobacteria bacterium]|jgi:diacylglycerol kinase (ATP)|nr:diacylglycerol kinase [Deltaproteobacteria bacterium]
MPRFPRPSLWLAAGRARKADRRALARLEALFAAGVPPQDIAREFGLDRPKLEALDRLASAPDGWRPIPAIIPEKDQGAAAAASLTLCRHGLVRVSLPRGALWLSDAGRYVLLLCAAEGRHPREFLPEAPGPPPSGLLPPPDTCDPPPHPSPRHPGQGHPMLKALLNIPGRARSAMRYSLSGLASSFRKEESVKLETIALAVLIAILIPVPWPLWKKLALTAGYLLVPFAELLNSSVEDICDLVSPGYNEKVKAAKDKGSAAVLLAIAANLLILAALIKAP